MVACSKVGNELFDQAETNFSGLFRLRTPRRRRPSRCRRMLTRWRTHKRRLLVWPPGAWRAPLTTWRRGPPPAPPSPRTWSCSRSTSPRTLRVHRSRWHSFTNVYLNPNVVILCFVHLWYSHFMAKLYSTDNQIFPERGKIANSKKELEMQILRLFNWIFKLCKWNEMWNRHI